MKQIVPFGQADIGVMSGGMPMSGRAKAANVVRLLLNHGADTPLEGLPDDLQASLTPRIGSMRIVDCDTLTAVVAEFAEGLERVGLSFPATWPGARCAGRQNQQTLRRSAAQGGGCASDRRSVEAALRGPEESDKGSAAAVRKAIFTFANIPQRIATRDIPQVLREVEQADLVTALAGAEAAGMGAARDFLLDNMSSRMADQLREEMEEAGKIKPSDAEAAMSAIVAKVREMEQAGTLLLVSEENEEE